MKEWRPLTNFLDGVFVFTNMTCSSIWAANKQQNENLHRTAYAVLALIFLKCHK